MSELLHGVKFSRCMGVHVLAALVSYVSVNNQTIVTAVQRFVSNVVKIHQSYDFL